MPVFTLSEHRNPYQIDKNFSELEDLVSCIII